MINFSAQYAQNLLPANYQDQLASKLQQVHQQLVQGTGEGSQYLGWLKWGETYDRNELVKLEELATTTRNHSQVLLVIGIGGSYLGAAAALDALRSPFYNQLPKNTPEIYFLGNGLAATNLHDVWEIIGDRDWSVNVISKSGTTLEPAITWRLVQEKLLARYGKERARERVVITTDRTQGALRQEAEREGYPTLVVPDDIGGRFSVLTSVGLFPLAVAGVKVTELLAGAAQAGQQLLAEQNFTNPAWGYAAARYSAWQSGKTVEVLGVYQPRLKKIGAWWQQLFGESEGKKHLGLYPDVVEYTADLHSLGQYLQDGSRHLLETILWCEQDAASAVVPAVPNAGDGLDYLAGRPLAYLNERAMLGTLAAHEAGGVPNLVIRIPALSEQSLGYLFYFFELAAGLSAYLLGVNPFDQPGVEEYKKRVVALLQTGG